MKILVTGATGKLGSKVVEELLKSVPASQLAVSVRYPEKAQHFRDQGIDVRRGDFGAPETLDAAFADIDRLLMISSSATGEQRVQQHINAVTAAKRAGVKLIAYTSIVNAEKSKNMLAPDHRATEKAIIKSGIAYVFLRNNWYLENELGTIQAVLAGAPWVTSAGSGKVGWALQQEYAAAAAAVLTGRGEQNTAYELSGKLLTQEELAAAVGRIIGRVVPVQQVDDAAYAENMKQAGLPDGMIPILVGIQEDIRKGTLEVASDDFESLLGHPLMPIDRALSWLI